MAPEKEKRKQLAVALSAERRNQLEAISAEAGHSVAEEIRQRLERTFQDDAVEAVTRELCEGIVNIAAQIRLDFGVEWHFVPRSHETFATAIAERIAAYAPPQSYAGAVTDLLTFVPDGAPETIGRLRERDDRRAHSYEHLSARQQRRAGRFERRVTKHGGEDE